MVKKILFLALVLGLVSPVFADYVMPAVENWSFEEPGNGKHNMWDEGTNTKGTFTDVPDWESDTVARDSGVEEGWGATDGTYTGFLMNGDPEAWNIVSYVIQDGDQFALQVDAKDNWSSNPPGVLQMALYYIADNGARTLLSTAPDSTLAVATTGDMAAYTLNVPTIDADAVGHLLCIGLDNVTDAPDGYATSWLGVDRVRFVPEPATVALLGLGGLALLRKRR